jgi:hypothetical protein
MDELPEHLVVGRIACYLDHHTLYVCRNISREWRQLYMSVRQEFMEELTAIDIFRYNDPILLKEIVRVLGCDDMLDTIIFEQDLIFDGKHDEIAHALMEYSPFIKYIEHITHGDNCDENPLFLYTMAKYVLSNDWIISYIKNIEKLWAILTRSLLNEYARDSSIPRTECEMIMLKDIDAMILIIENHGISIDSNYIIECIEDNEYSVDVGQYPGWNHLRIRILARDANT